MFKTLRSLHEIIKSLIEKINIAKELWNFVKNPKKKIVEMRGNTYPAVLNNPIYGSHKFIQLPNLKLHYVEKGPKTSELLLFVHGFPDFWFTWKNQIKEFSKSYWVVALDMRGYGESEKSTKVSFYDIQWLVEDIRNLVLYLGRNKFTLIAHDWGGVIAHYFIRIYPEMLNSYIMMNTVFHPKLSGNFLKNTRQFLKSWYILWMQIPYIPEYFFLTKDLEKIKFLFRNHSSPEELEAYRFMFGSYEKIRGPINYYRANFKNWRKGGVPTSNKLNKTKVSGLYVHGKKDVALTLRTAFVKSFDGVNNIKCICIPDAGHFTHLEKPDEVNKIIHNFLKLNKTLRGINIS